MHESDAGAEHPDVVVARIAARQHGMIALAQLLAARLGLRAIRDRVERGRLHRIHRAVYLVGAAVPLSPLARNTAALLAVPGALLAGDSAAAMWKLLPEPAHVELLYAGPGRPRRHRDGLGIRVVRTIHPHDRRNRDGLALTSPARTILDVSTRLTRPELERVVEEARVQRLVTAGELRAVLERAGSSPGTASLRGLLNEELVSPSVTRSEAERRMLALVRRARLPAPRANVRIHGHEVDLLWHEQGLVVEVDGYAFHGSRRAFERDRRRDADLLAGGLRVLRVSWSQIVDEPEALLVTIARALDAR